MYIDVDADEAWEWLRASRWNPPGKAETGSRRKTYAAALEQTEQMFRAAAVVGPATRPLQVFYGLSQAGRAIAAAAVSLKGEDWRLVTPGDQDLGVRQSVSPTSRSAPTHPAPMAASYGSAKCSIHQCGRRTRCAWKTCGTCCPRTRLPAHGQGPDAPLLVPANSVGE